MADLEKPWQEYHDFLQEKIVAALSPYDLQPLLAKFMRAEVELSGYGREEMAVSVAMLYFTYPVGQECAR
jgi:hypothetical protein